MGSLHDFKKFILDKYIPAKLSPKTLKIIFENNKDETLNTVLDTNVDDYLVATNDEVHAQLKCDKNLIYPFALNQDALPDKMQIKNVEQLVAADDNNKEIIELTLTNFKNVDYQPGDTIAILPKNSTKVVEQLLYLLQLDNKADTNCHIELIEQTEVAKKPNKLPTHLPKTITTPRELLRDCLNIRGVLKKQFLAALGEYCNDAVEANFLKCMSSKEATKHYNTLFLEHGFNLLDILETCSSCKPTLELLCEHLPRLLPRPYSIANSPIGHSNEVKIIFSILKDKPGITTTMLQQIACKKLKDINYTPKLYAYFRQSNKFRYTAEEAASNQIYIAIGTSLAPFLGFLEHKIHLKETNETLGKTWLFIGAKTEQSILYKNRLELYQNTGILDLYFESLSRSETAKYNYVQEQLEANAEELIEFWLKSDTILYLCADGAKISQSIDKALLNCLMNILQLDEIEAKNLLKEYRNSGKYREDIWN